MYCPSFLKVLILLACFTAVPGTLLTQTSSAQEALTKDVDPGTPLVDPGTPLVDPGTPLVDPGTPLVDPGTPLVDPGTPLVDPGTLTARDETDSGEEPFDIGEYLRLFVTNTAVVAFFVLGLLYVGHAGVTYLRAIRPVSAKRRGGSEGRISILRAVIYFDDGLLNIWTFFILTFFLPIFLSSMSDVVPVLNPNLDIIEERYHERFVSSSVVQTLYFISVVTISVLITLEFSYINNLWKNASEWIPTLLAALALDFANLLVLNFVVRHPDHWTFTLQHPDHWTFTLQHPDHWTFTPNPNTQTAMMVAVFLAFCSTFFILICARTAAALNAGQIDFPKSDDDIVHLVH